MEGVGGRGHNCAHRIRNRTRRANVETINIRHAKLTGYLYSHLPHIINHCECLGYFMPFYIRMHKFLLC